MENLLGTDFSDVRIHTDDRAAKSAAAVSAKAYTVGNEVVFGHGFFQPTSSEGRHRLAHELVHVQQQRKGPVSGRDRGDGIALSDPADSFEQQAEATAARVVSRSWLVVGSALVDRHQNESSIRRSARPVQRCGGMPCDCTADEDRDVQRNSVDASTFQAVQRAVLARSHHAAGNDQMSRPSRTMEPPILDTASAGPTLQRACSCGSTSAGAVQRQDQTGGPIPNPGLDDCMQKAKDDNDKCTDTAGTYCTVIQGMAGIAGAAIGGGLGMLGGTLLAGPGPGTAIGGIAGGVAGTAAGIALTANCGAKANQVCRQNYAAAQQQCLQNNPPPVDIDQYVPDVDTLSPDGDNSSPSQQTPDFNP
jgi:hypothetical protein